MFEGTVFDIALHSVTVLVASVLVAISFSAYKKKENTKFLYVCMAFAVFCVKEIMITVDTMMDGVPVIVASVHLLNLLILGLFFRGTVK